MLLLLKVTHKLFNCAVVLVFHRTAQSSATTFFFPHMIVYMMENKEKHNNVSLCECINVSYHLKYTEALYINTLSMFSQKTM